MVNASFVILSVKYIQTVFVQDAVPTTSLVKESVWQIWQAANSKDHTEIVRFVNQVTRREAETVLQE